MSGVNSNIAALAFGDLADNPAVNWAHLSRCIDIVLAAKEVGPSAPKIRMTTGVPKYVIDNAGYYLRQAGIWYGNNPHNMGVVYEWWDKYVVGEDEGLIGLLQTAAQAGGINLNNPSLFLLTHRPRTECGTWATVSRHQRRGEDCALCEAFVQSERSPWGTAARVEAQESQRHLMMVEAHKAVLAQRWAAHAEIIRVHKERLMHVRGRLRRLREERAADRVRLREERAADRVRLREERKLERFKLRQARLAEGWWEDAYGSLRPPDGWDWSSKSLDAPLGNTEGFTLSDTLAQESDFVESVAMEWFEYQVCIQICESYQPLQPIPNLTLDEILVPRPRRQNMKPANRRKLGHEDRAQELWTYNRGRVKAREDDPIAETMRLEREALRRDKLRTDGVLIT